MTAPVQFEGNFWRVTETFEQLTYLKQHPAELIATLHSARALTEHMKYMSDSSARKKQNKTKSLLLCNHQPSSTLDCVLH